MTYTAPKSSENRGAYKTERIDNNGLQLTVWV